MKEKICKRVEGIKEKLWEISDFMYHNPELGNEEFKASEKLTALLRGHGFEVETGFCNKPTAFRAIYDSGKPGPKVAFMCEYDALPGVGHGCGHNIIATVGAGAGIGLAEVVAETGGAVYVYGTPAEETNGAKVAFVREGVFKDVDFAMMLHPDNHTQESGGMLAIDAWEINFHGKSAHAAGDPYNGINALDAAIFFFNGMNALREHVKTTARMHGIITKGGVAPNIVPDFAQVNFYSRATKREYLNEINKKIENIINGAAMMAGATVDFHFVEESFDDMNSNTVMSKAWVKNMEALGFTNVLPPDEIGLGSADMGNVSYVVPSIHVQIDLGAPHSVTWHSKDVADLTITPAAHERIVQGAQSLAMTGCDLLTDAALRETVMKEFNKSKMH